MKKKLILLPILTMILCGCSKTNLLYNEKSYNSPVFDENYYTSREDIDNLEINSSIDAINLFGLSYTSYDGLDGIKPEDKGDLQWESLYTEKEKMFGYKNNLDSIDSSFNYGILSKLYDGRVRCDGYYQLSRVQLNKTGYATYFPKVLVDSKYFAFSCRGGTTLKSPLGLDSNHGLLFNFKISFYIHITNSNKYDRIDFNLKNVNVQTDNGGTTNLVSFYLPDLKFLNGAVAMSFEYECVDPRLETYGLTDDFNNKEKDHLALMLYEVFLPQSTWF